MTQSLLERLTEQVGNKDLAKSILVDRGHLNKDGTETEEGKARSLLGNEGRALERHVKRYGGSEDDYEYDPDTNRCYKVDRD